MTKFAFQFIGRVAVHNPVPYVQSFTRRERASDGGSVDGNSIKYERC